MSNLKVASLGVLNGNGSTTGLQLTGVHRNPTGSVNVRVTGTFDGGTVTVEVSYDNSNWSTVGDAGVFTDNGGCEVRALIGEYMRITGSGLGSGPVEGVILLDGTSK